MKVVVIIQARLSSSRLPAKVLLPLCGYSFITLVALRAANSGLDVLVATSNDQSDDILVDELQKNSINYFRGSLNNVLERFFEATLTLADDDIVVRLTGDNVFPDGNFVENLVQGLQQNKLDYFATKPLFDGFPYGMGVEAFRVSALRVAHQQAISDIEREHVTLFIRSRYEKDFFRLAMPEKEYDHLRCTLDTFDDYVRLQRIFSSVKDPVCIGWDVLCDKLYELESQKRVSVSVKNGIVCGSLVLGTAQLGMTYGIANKTGKPSSEDAKIIIKEATKRGVTHIDTASAYGDAEGLLGNSLNDNTCVITKLHFGDLPVNIENSGQIDGVVDLNVFKSCVALKRSSLPVVLLHKWEYRFLYDQMVWQRLLLLKKEGVIKKLGVSVYTPHDAIEALKDKDIEYLQIPFNILDWRWKASGFIKQLQERKEVFIHVRSALLQGILPAGVEIWPSINGFDAERCKTQMRLLCEKFNRESISDLCFAYLRAHEWIDGIVVGVETLAQLKENIRLFSRPPLTKEECSEIETFFNIVPEELLNPSKWKRAENIR